MSANYHKPVMDFLVVMLEKLGQNKHKRHWRAMSYRWLIERMEEEVEELKDAVRMAATLGAHESRENIRREAADIANFAMMIADKANHGLR